MSSDELYNSIKDRMEKARALAVTLGDVIGSVARNIPNRVEENQFVVNVVVSPEVYYKYSFLGKIGIFLGVVDIRTLYFILLKVVGYERSDVTNYLFDGSPVVSSVDEENPGTLINNVVIKCEMLTKLDVLSSSEIQPADVIVEPQSPVIIPRAEVIERALGINAGSLKLGFLDIEGERVKVSTSLDELNYHFLILGTTGAGKTSFIKDLLSGLYKLDEEGSKAFIFDTTGDYYHMFLPPDFTSKKVMEGVRAFEELYGKLSGIELDVVYPVTRGWLRKYLSGDYSINKITSTYYDLYVKPLVTYLERKGVKLYTSIVDNTINISSSSWSSKITVHPFFFKFSSVKRILYKLNPYFSEQGSHFLKIITTKSELAKLNTLREFVDALDDNVFEKMKLHRSTRENILRGLYLLLETGMFDLKLKRSSIREVVDKGAKIVVFDLYNSEVDDLAQKIFVYYILDRIFALREARLRKGEAKGRYLIVIDEAHKFFPSMRGGEEDNYYVRRVASKISLMMRLGRRRKIGFIFATHNPNDLNDIVVQLSNTKVIFRIRQEIAELFGLSRNEAKVLSWEGNGVAFIISPWLREGRVKIRVPVPPPVGHYDLSRT
ncbi:MAG: ATP-binding protein [Candidatus Aramenus sp.]|nr:ATP-binding protein [Candidatus Aramenus sp.]